MNKRQHYTPQDELMPTDASIKCEVDRVKLPTEIEIMYS